MNNYIANLSLRGKFLLIAIAMLVPISVSVLHDRDDSNVQALEHGDQ